ncbi:MAG: malonyl-ACP O-methyltransferase BioC [Pseudomonadales bacterium]|nr:malonyl-ACP O-methyltransferase BioC [Pseudomonadales bacterium]
MHINRHFSRAARSYDANAELQLAVGRSLVQRLPVELVMPTALDLGCATAPFARAQQQALPDVLWQGVDLSSAMLNEAAERGRLNDAYQPLCADAEALPLENGSQGLVFSCFALQWCDPGRVMAEVHRVLAPGGRLLLAVPLCGSLQELHQSWQAVNQRPHVNRLPSLNEWQDAALRAGFADAELQQQVMVEYYDTVKHIARRLKATGADHVNGASGLTGKQAWQAMVKEYETRRTEQGLPLTWKVLFLEAEKQ